MSFLCTLLMLVSCGDEKKNETEKPVVRVQTEVVEYASNCDERDYVGVVEEQSATSVSFTGSGTVARVCVSAGQHVSKGQLIAELDKTQANNAVAMAEAMMT